MARWTVEQLDRIATSDDFLVAPYREDGFTPGTPVWVWAALVDGVVYVRTDNPSSRWFAAAVREQAGHASGGGYAGLVAFERVRAEALKDRVDDAFAVKYGSDPYFSVELLNRSRDCVLAVTPVLTDPRTPDCGRDEGAPGA